MNGDRPSVLEPSPSSMRHRLRIISGKPVSSQGRNGLIGSGSSYESSPVDKKMVELVCMRLDKLIRICRNPRLRLRNSPPYLLDILPDMISKLKHIVDTYVNNLDELFNIPYFCVFLNNLMKKCVSVSGLFNNAKDRIFNENSEDRRTLNKSSLVFSHILKDLEALFPGHKFTPDAFRITKKDAGDWWHEKFSNQPIINWQSFQLALCETFNVKDKSQLLELQETIDLTGNNFVSIFEFDVFVRLFQPWNNVIETWEALTSIHTGYMAFMTYDEVKAVLKRFRHQPGPGSYVYRLSCTKLGQWAIGYITKDLHILQTIIQNKSLAQALIDGEQEGFYLYPNGLASQSSILKSLVKNLAQPHLKVPQEQHQLYSRIGSTFELCKICTENNKNIQLEPCGHLMCKRCLVSCQSSGTGQTCPFCRLEIKSVEEIVLDSFKLPSEEATDIMHTSYLSESADNCLTNNEAAASTSAHTSGRSSSKSSRGDQASASCSPVHSAPMLLPFDSSTVQNELESVTPTAPIGASSLPIASLETFSWTSDIDNHPGISTLQQLPLPFTDISDNIDDLPSPPPIPGTSSESSGAITSASTFDTLSIDTDRLLQRSDISIEGPPMTSIVAQQLLEITRGDCDMAAEIWQHFVPRASPSSP